MKNDNKPVTRSRLQKIQTQANWAVYFQLHFLESTHVSELTLSSNTRALITHYNNTVERLRASILEDARKNREYILRETKKEID